MLSHAITPHLLQRVQPAHLEQQLAGIRQLQAGHVVCGLGGGAHRVAPRLVPVPQQPAVLAHVHLRTPGRRIGHSQMQGSCRLVTYNVTQPGAVVEAADADADDAEDADAEDAVTIL